MGYLWPRRGEGASHLRNGRRGCDVTPTLTVGLRAALLEKTSEEP